MEAGQGARIRQRTAEMLREELRHVRGIPADADPIWFAATKRKAAEQREPGKPEQLEPLSALCFSGGGIRSAAFNLGVARALAHSRLLGRFDYLSTVSGGGYIGAWLQVLITQQAPGRPHAEKVGAAETVLVEHETGALDRLRDHTNFLAPRGGFAAVDSWAGVVLYTRNLILNWLVLLPVLFLVVLAPVFHRTATWQVGHSGIATWGLLGLAWLGLCFAVWRTARALPSHQNPAGPGWRGRFNAAGPGLPVLLGRPARIWQDMVAQPVRWVVICAMAWALIAPALLQHAGWRTGCPEEAACFAVYQTPAMPTGWLGLPAWLVLPLAHAAAMLIGYGIAMRWPAGDDPRPGMYRDNFMRWFWATAGAAGVMATVLAVLMPHLVTLKDDSTMLTLFAPIGLVFVHLLQTSFFVGLRRSGRNDDLDREWVGRLDGTILLCGAGWTVFAFICVIVSSMLIGSEAWKVAPETSAAGMATAGGLGAWLARNASSWGTRASKSHKVMEVVNAHLPTLLSAAFIFLLLSLLAWILPTLIGTVLGPILKGLEWPMPLAFGSGSAVWENYAEALPAGWMQVVAQLAMFLLLVVALVLLRHTNINRYSMHTVYRNRLVRAFLGTPRLPRDRDMAADPARRNPEWFTGIDPRDNIVLSGLKAAGGKGQKLFPVINATLNLSAGARDAWAERRGASFTATPLHCGSSALDGDGRSEARGAFVPTEHYAGRSSRHSENAAGVRLGAMITTSGAAASPHWGYHTSPLTAFAMTLFNVRLGLWLPNPARATREELELARPPNALRALLGDLIGRTTARNQAVYLSDGGHFENLGIYEMLRRRCARIVVVDAGEDGDCAFFDLGAAIRKAEIDMPVRVTMGPMRIRSRKAIEGGAESLGIAVGKIEYLKPRPSPDGPPALSAAEKALEDWRAETTEGQLIYIKPSFLPDLPAACRAYGLENTAFPHEPTLDQFFSESQFESYHVLGWFQTHKIAARCRDGVLEDLFEAARTHCQAPAGVAAPSSLLLGARRGR